MAYLQKFYCPHLSIQKIPEKDLPNFLVLNLQDDKRVIERLKGFKYPYAHVRVFVFQFFKLCFEGEDVDYQTKINKFIQIVQEKTYLFESYFNLGTQTFEPNQCKIFVLQFLQLLNECLQPVQITICHYPAILEILSKFFINFYKQTYQNQKLSSNPNFKIINHLCRQFQIDNVQYEKCIQFSDTQIYLYEHSIDDIYMVYIDYNKQTKSVSSCRRSVSLQFTQQFLDQSDVKIDMEPNTADTFNKSQSKNQTVNVIKPIQNKQNIKLARNSQLFQELPSQFIVNYCLSEPYRQKVKQLKQKFTKIR